MSETNQLTNLVINYFISHGAVAWRNNTGAAVYQDPARSGHARFLRYGKKGSGDIFVILPGGTFLSVEVKTGKDRLRDSQREWIREIEQVGGLALVVHELEDAIIFWRHWEKNHAPTQVKVVAVPTDKRNVIVRHAPVGKAKPQVSGFVMDDAANGVVAKPVAVMTYDAERNKWVKVRPGNPKCQSA